MQSLTLDELDRRWADVEAAADATPGIDPWCSGPDWQLPVAAGFAPDAPRLLLATDDGTGFALLSRYPDGGRSRRPDLVSGLEPLWGFGCPLLGPDPTAVATMVADVLAADDSWQTVLLPGLPPIPRSRLRGGPPADPADHRALGADHTTLPIAVTLSRLGRTGFAEGITRQLIDLRGGHEAWLDRRSPKFRRNLRRAERRAADSGLTIVDATTDRSGSQGGDPVTDDGLFDRILAIEARSWKGRQGSGLVGDDMATTYRTMIGRLRRRDRLLAHIAVLDGVDVGYILGGIRDRRYRGLQLSYITDDQPDGDGHDDGPDEDETRRSEPTVDHLSIGNLLQAHHLRLLTDEDRADVYDLGMDIDYKRRWADRPEPSVMLVVQR